MPVTHIEVLGFDSQLWLQIPASQQGRLWEAIVMAAVIGYLSPM